MNRHSVIQLAGTLALSAGVLLAVPGLVGSAAASGTGAQHHPYRHVHRHHRPSAGVSTGSGASASLTATATATSAAATSSHFVKVQQALELQLTNRQHQLAKLSADTTGSKTLTPVDATVLSSRLATETTSIDTLAAKVPSDTTLAELRVDDRAMLKDNRVYAVMTPQVIEVIESDSISAQVSLLQGEEASLSASVTALVGQPGYKSAAAHYRSFVARVDAASRDTVDVSTAVLAQMPSGFPGNTHVFVQANRKLLAAQVDVAYANYEASLIGLATGGYTGS